MTWGVITSKPDRQKEQVQSIAGQVPEFQKGATQKAEFEMRKTYASPRAYICAGRIFT
jgi:hypothetical protein